MITEFAKYSELLKQKQAEFKYSVDELEELINDKLPPGRARSLALTSLEEMYMRVGKALRDEQLEQDAKTRITPEKIL